MHHLIASTIFDFPQPLGPTIPVKPFSMAIEVLSTNVLNTKYTIVQSQLLATDKKPAVNIEWRVYTKNPDKPLIRDLIIEGLSLARTQKEEFASVIETNNGDITKLFITLKEFVAK